MKNVAIMFGGVTYEHEVSIITGLQVVENIDREKYNVYAIYLDKKGDFKLFTGLVDRKGFRMNGGVVVNWGKDEVGPFFRKDKPLSRKIRIDVAYLAFHGGNGESGPLQGFFDTLSLPYTSCSVESSSIVMNKSLTKEVLNFNKIKTVDGVSIKSSDIRPNVDAIVNNLVKTLKLPMIVKPVHLGSSIGIEVAKTIVQLKKSLLLASQIDNEILVEKFVSNFTEYNCSVRSINSVIETSEIEKPLSRDEILSFADKYERGGNKKSSGMASLVRDLPADIPFTLKTKLQETARKVFLACRCRGLVRVDFMVDLKGEIYVTEVNPIPGSMAFYLWEASGISFTDQISDLIEESLRSHEKSTSNSLSYSSEIVEKFIQSKK